MRAEATLLATAALLLAGCTPVEMRGEQRPERLCRPGPWGHFVGRPGAPGVIEEARRVSGARIVRVLREGEAATMDYRGDRLTVVVDKFRVITHATCG